MTVHELIERLGKFPSDTQVILSIDEEGNGFSPVGAVEKELIRTDHDEIVSGDDKEYIADLRENYIELLPVVVLWP